MIIKIMRESKPSKRDTICVAHDSVNFLLSGTVSGNGQWHVLTTLHITVNFVFCFAVIIKI